MKITEQTLIDFFMQVAKKDKVQLNKIKQAQCFSIDEFHWNFTLPELHAFLQHHESVFTNITYKQFRKLIFNSPVNQTTKSYGAEITIADNQTKVDKSSYSLVWHK